ncbi:MULTISPECIES: SUMF1/EgtB/PvdO family nonheme iron enzyme [unclassified Prochlorococcus]|uniref:SUMF1/EgtB/PvdO family nonheme iron enzyme n=1 Tax=unclassified Prochlorococcus TaxID=2627481 RepID=UPI0039A6A499
MSSLDSSVDLGNEQDNQASINAGQQPYAADGEATNNSNASPATTSAPNSEASNLSGNGSPTSVSSSSADPSLSLNPVATASTLIASTDADVSTNAANSPFEYYVSNDGDDANLGTINAPFKTIQHAINNVGAGDIVNIRGGIYRETLTLDGVHGTEDNWITFQNYNNEDVLLSGAKQIKSPWTIHKENIWKTNVWSEDVQFDISQLFIDDKMLTGARWPNINKDYDQPDADFWHTWSSAKKIADGSYEDKGGLEELGVSVEGATAYIKGKGAAVITSHNAGESQFLSDPQANNITSTGKLGDGDYFIEGDIDLLDRPREWYYDRNTGDLFAWLENDQNPNDANIEARTHGKGNYGANNLMQINNSNYLKFDGLNLFSGAFSFVNSNHIAYENSSFLYPAHNGLMLGENHFPGGNVFKGVRNYSSDLTLKNNEFAYSYGLLFDGGRNSTSDIHLENNHFHNSNIMLWGSNGGPVVMSQNNVTAIRNSVHDMGWGGLGRPGYNNHLELNHIYDTKWSSDTGGITANQSIDNLVIRRNWVHGIPRNGIRLDGHPGGVDRIVDHNVSFQNGRGFYLKGDQHQIHNNLAFNNTVDLGIPSVKFYGYNGDGITKDDRIISRDTSLPQKGNHLSVVHNNSANSIPWLPVLNPEDKTNNSSAFDRGHGREPKLLHQELRDPGNLDFRLRSDSVLIDAGKSISGFTDPVAGISSGTLGQSPDIGPYEFSDTTYWIPGHQTDQARMPIAPDGSLTVKADADLMWLEGREAVANNIYLGSDPSELTFQASQLKSHNIFTPSVLAPGETYYWRIDTVTDQGEDIDLIADDTVVLGDTWQFTVDTSSDSLEIESVYVGDVNNPNGKKTVGGKNDVGSVGYGYYIGKYEVTNDEYATFLNNAARYSDEYGLWSPNMASRNIIREGEEGNWVYKSVDDMERHPVTNVSWEDAARFSNWMTSGSVDIGTYGNINSNNLYKDRWHDVNLWGNGGVAIANQSEWHKAAYYSGDPNGGKDGELGYFAYATQSNTISTDDANFGDIDGEAKAVGSYATPSYYETYDQTGNVHEWTENRGYRVGGDFRDQDPGFSSDSRITWNFEGHRNNADVESDEIGFRVVSLAPITSWNNQWQRAPLFDNPGEKDINLLEIQEENLDETEEWIIGNVPIGKDYSFSVADSYVDPNRDAISYSHLQGPSWLYMDSQGNLSGRPVDEEDLGLHSIGFRATDSSNLYHNTDIPISINITQDLNATQGDDLLIGRAGVKHIFGLAGEDHFKGSDEDEVFHGGAGRDRINGGLGRDKARFSGKKSDYQYYLVDDAIEIIDTRNESPDGTDVLIDIEELSFIDGNRTLADAWVMSKDLKHSKIKSFAEQFSNSSLREASSSQEDLFIPLLKKETNELQILKTDLDGSTKWIRPVSSNAGLNTTTTTDVNGNIYISWSETNGDSKINKLSTDGEIQWTQALTQDHAIYDLKVVDDQLYAVGGTQDGSSKAIYKSLKTETGEINWQKDYNTTLSSFVDVESDGSSLYLGTSSHGKGKAAGRGAHVVKVDLDGNEEWFSTQTVGNWSADMRSTIFEDQLLTGGTTALDKWGSNYSYRLVSRDLETGDILWDKHWGDSDDQRIEDIVSYGGSAYAIGADYDDLGNGIQLSATPKKTTLFEIEKDGSISRELTFDSSNPLDFNKSLFVADGQMYLSARTSASSGGADDTGSEDIFLSQITTGFEQQAPNNIDISNLIFEESLAINSVVATLSTSDQNFGDSHTYSLVAGLGDKDNSLFVIEGNQLKANDSSEHQSKDSYTIRVKTSDSSQLTFEKSFSLAVNGLADERTNPAIASSWAENQARTLDSDLELGYSLHLKEGTEADQATARKQLAVLGDSVDLSDTYRLDITAKSLAAGYNLETADITINFDPYLFDEIKASDITIGGQLPIANAVQIDNVEGTIRIAAASLGDLEAGDLYGNHLTDAGASIGTDGAVLASIDLDFNELNLAELKKNLDGSIDDLSTPLFFGLSANQDETVFSTALDDESGFANREIKSLRELGGDLAVDGTKVTLYEAEINLKEQGDGLILSSDLDIGSYHSSKTNLLRKGDTITATSEWTNVGNIKATDIAITGVANDNASLSSSSFYISTTEGEGYQALTNLESGSFSSTTGAFDSTGQETAQLVADIEITGAAGNVVDLSAGILSLKAEGSDVFENKLGSKNLITYQGDLNYDGRVSMKDLAYLNAGAARQQLVSEGQAAADANNDGFVDASVARGVDANFDGQISMADLAVLDADWGKSLHQVPQASTDAFLGESEISWEQLESQGTTGDTTWDNQAFKDQNALEADNDFVESLESPAAVGVIDADGDSSRTDNDIAGDYFQDPLNG